MVNIPGVDYSGICVTMCERDGHLVCCVDSCSTATRDHLHNAQMQANQSGIETEDIEVASTFSASLGLEGPTHGELDEDRLEHYQRCVCVCVCVLLSN